MNTKYLYIWFPLLAIVVALSLWAVFYGQGLRMGIDLQGGYVLDYEINVASNESPTVVDDVISVLKKRVDPLGVYGIEFKAKGRNHFEVKMPAARKEADVARRAYREAVDQLEADNIQRSDLLEICTAAEDDQARLIAAAAGADSELAAMLGDAAKAYRQLETAQKALEAATGGDRQEAYIEHQKALSSYEKIEEKVLQRNVPVRVLQTVLQSYVPANQESALKKSVGSDEVNKLKEFFRSGYQELVDKHPHRKTQIDKTTRAYQAWAAVRRRLENPDDLKRIIAKSGVLEFRIAPAPGAGEPGATEIAQYKRELLEQGAEAGRKAGDDYQWFPIQGEAKDFLRLITHTDQAGQVYVLLSNRDNDRMVMDDKRKGHTWKLSDAYPTTDRFNKRAVGFEFDSAGASQFASLTSNHINHALAIVLDDRVYSAPNIQSTISGSGIITGSFSKEELSDLIRTLDAGQLPARLNPDPVAERTHAPDIGAVNAELGKNAAQWGLIAVAAFMLIYYLRAGFVADVALLLNLILVLGAMSLMRTALTLPGIAGLILTIGIAVDANVLIFERLREEQAKAQPVRNALKNAYQRAFSAIFDANITTLITCLILAWVGTDAIVGFAITLMLGILISMFTALVVTRWIFQAAIDLKLLTKPLHMLHIIGVPNINWMKSRRIFWTISAVLLAVGIGSLVWQGSDVLGIELAAGTDAMIEFKDVVLLDGEPLNDEAIRTRLNRGAKALRDRYATQTAGNPPAETQSAGGSGADVARKIRGLDKLMAANRVVMVINEQRVQEFLAAHADGADTITETRWNELGLDPAFFKAMNVDGNDVVTRDELEQRLPNRTYRVTTTETDLNLVRAAIKEAFGPALVKRSRCEHTFLTGAVAPQINVQTDPTGATRITRQMIASAPTNLRSKLVQFLGGMLYVVDLKLDEKTEALTAGQLADRIRVTRTQPEFKDQQLTPTEVVGLTAAGPNTFKVLAVMVRPIDELETDQWKAFADVEKQILTEALHREDAIDATSFTPQIAGTAKALAAVAIVLSCLAIVLYLWLRFGSARWGLAAVICLIHDVIIVVGMVAVSGWLHETFIGKALGIESFKIDLAMIAAFLTVIGYSVNDTIVVFDRIRENRGKLSTVSSQVINNSVNQTLSRTLLTSGTTFIVVFIMYVRGGTGIHAFSYALLMGVIFGTYSSIAIASPLLMGFKKALVARGAALAAVDRK